VGLTEYLTKARRKKAKNEAGQREVAKRLQEEKGSEPRGEAKGTLVDIWSPYQTTHGYWVRPSGLSYEHLRAIAKRVGLVASVIWTRMNQAAAFAKLPADEFDSGFRIRPRDKKQKVTRAVQSEIDYITDFILNCGDRSEGRMFTGDSFQSLMRKSVRDSLTYDQVNIQIHQRLNGKPYELISMPAHTIRRAAPKNWHIREVQSMYSGDRDTTMEPSDVDDVRYVQVYQGIPIADFTARELTFGVRNPRSDLDVSGYGFSEIEECVYSGDLTRLAQADAHNTLQFKQGSLTDGILNYEEGSIKKKELRNLARQWKAMVMGVENAFRLPIMNAPGLKYLRTNFRTNRDMEFTNWYEQIIRRILAIFQIDGAELGLSYGNVGQKSSLAQAGVLDKVKSSKDRGLRPILAMLAEMLTRHIVMLFNPDLILEFVGIDYETENERIEKVSKKVEKFMTVNEGRAEFGLEEREDGDIILNQVWLQAKQAGEAQEAEGAPEGMPAEGEEGAAPEEGEEGADFMSLFGGAGEEEEEPAEETEKSLLDIDHWFRA
jgi:hypothetical protein